jgi:drug/metabolite transporter (DMT)-like permease
MAFGAGEKEYMDRTKSSYIYAGLAILFWSTIPTAFKICLGELGLLPMLTIAATTSALVLLVIILTTNKWRLLLESKGIDLLYSAILGLLNPFLYYIILLKAYKILPAQVAQPLNMIWPIILVFLSVPLLRQKIQRRSFIALFISFAGVWLISSQGHPFSVGGSDPSGVLLATGSSVFWAIYFILNVRDKRDDAIKLFLNFFFGTLYLLAAVVITGGWQHTIGLKGVLGSVYVGMFEMGITFFFWLKALSMAETTDRVSNLVYFAPFISLLFVHFILNEPVYYTTPCGLLLIIGGILIQNRKKSRI